MGLDIHIKGLSREDTYHGSYIRFASYRVKVAKAFNKAIGEIYEKPYKYYGYKFTEEDEKQWNEFLLDENAPMNKFLWHSDCDGKLTPKECKKIYNAMKDLKVEMQGHNYIEMNYYDMHQLWLNMLKHCYKHRVNMYFY